MEPSRKFADLLQNHCRSGTGRVPEGSRRKAWTDAELGEEMGREGRAVTGEAVRTWRKGKHLPKIDSKDALVNVFFSSEALEGQDECVKADREAFEHAWNKEDEAARSEVGSRAGSDAIHPDLEWRVWPGPKTNPLVELGVYSPVPTNEPSTLSLRVSVVVNLWNTERDGIQAVIGLRSMQLLVTSSSYQIVHQSTIADRQTESHFRRIVDGVEIFGPVDPLGRINSQVLGDEPLTQVKTVGSGADPIDISLLATRQSFTVEVAEGEDGSQEPSQNKKHVLDAVLYSDLKKDRFGRFVLADAKLKRTEANKDDL